MVWVVLVEMVWVELVWIGLGGGEASARGGAVP